MKHIFLALLSVVALVSCGGGIGRQGVLTSSSAQRFASEFSSLISKVRADQAPTLPSQGMPSGITTSAIRTRTELACVKSDPTAPVDADGDGIALTKTYTYDCENVNTGSQIYKYKGSTKIEDLDDTKKWSAGGYKVTYDAQSSYEGAEGKGEYGYSGYWSAIASGNILKFSSDYTARVAGKYNAYPAPFDYTLRAVWTMTQEGDNPDQPWLGGTWNSKGLYELNGTFVEEGANNSRTVKTGNTTLEFRSEDMRYDSTCSQYIKSGKWIMIDGGGNKLEIIYNCTTFKKYLNGTEFN